MPKVEQVNVLRNMTPADRWRVAISLYWQAREWKEAALRSLHPDWSETQIRQFTRELFLHGHIA
ncbi:MAG: hypothetical protein A2498_04060 [Lentisphaerae bacterium RIFOXYC12_FULL_60_16]|nr:MAG: hypothetical protein A2498_04060 [Lentisphaerae bacterium RIFOXYC12_FULL_60_16]OGV79560.1 MAG: hypothetical protein A2340_11240 [Lentisphaerae bacterium RIFOXYB12_FULL_60_10]